MNLLLNILDQALDKRNKKPPAGSNGQKPAEPFIF